MKLHLIDSEPLDPVAYLPFGEVIGAAADRTATDANQGTSRRYDRLCVMENLRPDSATLNVCVFRTLAETRNPVPLRVMEKHPYSTQTFAPLSGAGSYLVVVAPGKKSPDLASLRGFVVAGALAISYRPGIWHHPLIALEPRGASADFLCHIYEENADDFPDTQNTVVWNDPGQEIQKIHVSTGAGDRQEG